MEETFEHIIDSEHDKLMVKYSELVFEWYSNETGENIFLNVSVNSQVTAKTREAVEKAIHDALMTIKDVGVRINTEIQ